MGRRNQARNRQEKTIVRRDPLPGQAGRSGAAPVHEEASARLLSETKFDAFAAGWGEIFAIREGISGL